MKPEGERGEGLNVVFRRRSESRERGPAPRPAEAHGPVLAGAKGGPNDRERRAPMVLCVEDGPTHLKILCRYLEHSLGCRVRPAASVEEAVAALIRKQPDLIVADLLMPGLNGLDLMTILQVRRAWQDIPIVVVSAVSDVDRIRALTGQRVKDYLVKPFNPAVAIPRFRRVLESLALEEEPGPSERLSFETERVPVLLATAREEVGDLVRKAAGPLFDVVAVDSGPAALVGAMEIYPWTVLLTGDLAPWDRAKTMRSLLALKGLQGIRVIPLPDHDRDAGVLSDAVRRELSPPPFAVSRAGAVITVTIEETFVLSCLGALGKALDEAVARETERVVFELPWRGVGRQVLPALQELVEMLRMTRDEERS